MAQQVMAGPNIWAQFKGLLEIRFGFIQLPHEKLGLSKALPTVCIERIQVNGAATQWKSFVKAAKKGCRGSRQSYKFGISGFQSNRPPNGKIGRASCRERV